MAPSQPESGQSSYLPSGLGPLVYDEDDDIHIKIVEDTQKIYLRSALNKCSLLEEGERRQEVHDALLAATSQFGSAWTMVNEGRLYKTLSALSGNIASACKKIACTKVQSGYSLRPSIWSDDSETEHQKRVVKDLTAEGLFPPKFIFGKDEHDKWYAFENEVIWDVILNTVLELGYQPYLEELDNIFCTAAVAVYCALKELSKGKFQFVDFAVSEFKPKYTKLMDHIRDHITPNAELSKRWKEYKRRTLHRLSNICA
ncbi:hypothetical protein DFH29DRAFT_997849 [Suillus ampliporus]|nr:hypothetical protein DFH29DRAFT_997849 [Suillus ampliporus]